ncbi:MAG: YggS family pyridoxal phosphate-dependent enzyme [Bacteroidales bacterium]|nr:YggS family pyridoxal phosphate-dependent enzyme [Bacteroidales bacterium]
MTLQANLQHLIQEIPSGVRLVAVSKTQSLETIRALYDAGQRIFGENKVQELITKYPRLPDDIEWHFIGHIQRNKVKFIVPVTSLIHSIDSFRLLKEVNREAGKISRKVNCLLQFHIAAEESKFGLSWEEAVDLLSSDEFPEMNHVNICGVMGMATFTDNQALVRKEFRHLRTIFQQLKERFFNDSPDFTERSMGMTNDYNIAIEEGSTLIRIGTMLFGPRLVNVHLP